ncbi:MAG: helix-turn-helix transcriptional regulator [Phycisphaeraceae bacterium]
MPSDRVNRLLQLITLLQTRTGWDGQSLARELDISTRTLFRDLNTLEQAGIPCRSDDGGGYRIQQGFFLPPVSLSASEVLGLMQLTRFVGQHRERPFHAHALSAIYKLISTVPEPLRSTCGQMLAHINTRPDPKLPDDAEARVFTQLQQSIDLGRACELLYTSPAEDGPLRLQLEPYLLHHANRAWYVLGKTDLHDEVRMLKLIRIESVTMLTRVFDKPRGFTAEQKLGNAWCMIPEGREYTVELEFTPRVARNVSEVQWHPSQSHKLLADGCCVMTFKVDGLNEIAWWVCGYADQVTVRKPKKLREIVARMHQSAAALYDHS